MIFVMPKIVFYVRTTCTSKPWESIVQQL